MAIKSAFFTAEDFAPRVTTAGATWSHVEPCGAMWSSGHPTCSSCEAHLSTSSIFSCLCCSWLLLATMQVGMSAGDDVPNVTGPTEGDVKFCFNTCQPFFWHGIRTVFATFSLPFRVHVSEVSCDRPDGSYTWAVWSNLPCSQLPQRPVLLAFQFLFFFLQ